MKTSARKILVVLLVVGCLLVLGAIREASAQSALGPVMGNYACTFSGTTFVSEFPFTHPPDSTEWHPTGYPVSVNAYNGYGVWTFRNDGTGNVELSLIYSIVNSQGTPYAYTPLINSQHISFGFTYTVAADTTIIIYLDPPSYKATFKLGGIDYEYTTDKFDLTGQVSMDRTSITLTSYGLGLATRYYTKYSNPPENYYRFAISHRSFVLHKIGH